jgi:hypothetical protein
MNIAEKQLADMHALDLSVPCPQKGCLRPKGKACKGLGKGIVHIARRIKRLLTGRRTEAGV